tara:strand:- start:1503 stop:2165 length:663 start_codon:yes stop_codon:yes gene_type:complete
MSVALIILTLNEIDGVKEILPKIKKEWVDEILVVDGGSTDGTIEYVKKIGFKIIIQSKKGHGAAIIEGVRNTKSDKILIFGPDGNHKLEEIKQLIEKSEEGFEQVVISRFGHNSINNNPNSEVFGNKLFASLVNIFFKSNLTDVLNESRIITRDAFNELKFDALQLDSTFQMTIRSIKKKQKYFEITGSDNARIGGKRKMRPFHTGCLLIKRLVKEFFYH